MRKQYPDAPLEHLWVTQAAIDQNLRDFADQFAATKPKEPRPAAEVLNAANNYAHYQKHQLMQICLWALRRHPKLVSLRAKGSIFLKLFGAKVFLVRRKPCSHFQSLAAKKGGVRVNESTISRSHSRSSRYSTMGPHKPQIGTHLCAHVARLRTFVRGQWELGAPAPS